VQELPALAPPVPERQELERRVQPARVPPPQVALP
jgi:hypothetical protein